MSLCKFQAHQVFFFLRLRQGSSFRPEHPSVLAPVEPPAQKRLPAYAGVLRLEPADLIFRHIVHYPKTDFLEFPKGHLFPRLEKIESQGDVIHFVRQSL